MPRKELNLINLSLNDPAQTVLGFFKDNSDFFEHFENVIPSADLVDQTFRSCPEGVSKDKKVVLGCFCEGELVGYSELIMRPPKGW